MCLVIYISLRLNLFRMSLGMIVGKLSMKLNLIGDSMIKLRLIIMFIMLIKKHQVEGQHNTLSVAVLPSVNGHSVLNFTIFDPCKPSGRYLLSIIFFVDMWCQMYTVVCCMATCTNDRSRKRLRFTGVQKWIDN